MQLHSHLSWMDHIYIFPSSKLAGLYVGGLQCMSCLNTCTITLAIKMPNQREKADDQDFFFTSVFFLFFFLTAAPGLQDPSSPARD